MGLPEDFVSGISTCMNASFVFPSIALPGLPNLSFSAFAANFAGINYVIGFLPPNPDHLPSIPAVSLFLDPFMAAIKLPAAYPGINISLGGVAISIPGVGSPPYAFDVTAMMNVIACMIAAPFLLIKTMVLSIINLQVPTIPSISFITTFIQGLFVEAGFNFSFPYLSALFQFAGCLATAIFNLFTAVL